MQLRLSSIAILSLFVAGLLLLATRTAGAATATATINSVTATGVGTPSGDGDLYGQRPRPGDHAQALRIAGRITRVSYS